MPPYTPVFFYTRYTDSKMQKARSFEFLLALHKTFRIKPEQFYADFIIKNVSTSASTVGRFAASSFKPWNSTVLR